MVRVSRRITLPDDAQPRKFVSTMQTHVMSTLSGILCGEFKTYVDCLYRIEPRPQTHENELYLCSFSNSPDKCYVMTNDTVVEAGSNIEQVMKSLHLFEQRFSYTFEGNVYSIGWSSAEEAELMVSIGVIKIGGQLTNSIIVEIEYKPCSQLEQAHGIMEEFMHLVTPDIEPKFSYDDIMREMERTKLSIVYSNSHRAVQHKALAKQK